MTYLILRSTDRVRERFDEFDRLLEAGGLNIVERTENSTFGIVEIVIDDRSFSERQLVDTLAHRCFDGSLAVIKQSIEQYKMAS